MNGGKTVDAGPGTAVLKIKAQVGGPKRISDNFVKTDGAAVEDKGRFGGIADSHPRNVLKTAVDVCLADGSEVFAGLGGVDHQGKLVSLIAFVHSRTDKEIVVAVIDVKGRFYVVFTQFDVIGAFSVDRVLKKASSLAFPAVVDVGTAAE